jgi:hypothetical protein
MRRALASFFVFVIGLPLITPLVLADPRSGLPACCRRDGKHHCAMTDQASPRGPSVKNLQPKCLFFPKPGVLSTGAKTAIIVVTTKIGAANPVALRLDHAISSVPQIGSDGAKRKRGPPQVFD